MQPPRETASCQSRKRAVEGMMNPVEALSAANAEEYMAIEDKKKPKK